MIREENREEESRKEGENRVKERKDGGESRRKRSNTDKKTKEA